MPPRFGLHCFWRFGENFLDASGDFFLYFVIFGSIFTADQPHAAAKDLQSVLAENIKATLLLMQWARTRKMIGGSWTWHSLWVDILGSWGKTILVIGKKGSTLFSILII